MAGPMTQIGSALNDELTIVINGVASAMAELEAGHPARIFLIDAGAAARRCGHRAAELLAVDALPDEEPDALEITVSGKGVTLADPRTIEALLETLKRDEGGE